MGPPGDKGEKGLLGEPGITTKVVLIDIFSENVTIVSKGNKGAKGFRGETGIKGVRGEVGSRGLPVSIYCFFMWYKMFMFVKKTRE